MTIVATETGERTASLVRNYGMRSIGGWGVRGFRAHCPECGYLSRLYDNIRGASRRAHDHRCGENA